MHGHIVMRSGDPVTAPILWLCRGLCQGRRLPLPAIFRWGMASQKKRLSRQTHRLQALHLGTSALPCRDRSDSALHSQHSSVFNRLGGNLALCRPTARVCQLNFIIIEYGGIRTFGRIPRPLVKELSCGCAVTRNSHITLRQGKRKQEHSAKSEPLRNSRSQMRLFQPFQ